MSDQDDAGPFVVCIDTGSSRGWCRRRHALVAETLVNAARELGHKAFVLFDTNWREPAVDSGAIAAQLAHKSARRLGRR